MKRPLRWLVSCATTRIHKATGWMLLEAGKRGREAELLAFLDCWAAELPRTALRYAIERLSPERRRHYLNVKKVV